MTKEDFSKTVRNDIEKALNANLGLASELDYLYSQIADYWYLYGILFEKGHCVTTKQTWSPNDEKLLEFAKFIGKPLYRVYDTKNDVYWIGTNVPALTDTWFGERLGLSEYLRDYADEDVKIYHPSGAVEIRKAA